MCGTASRLRKSRWFHWRIWTVVLLVLISVPIWRAATKHTKAPPAAPAAKLPVVAVTRADRRDLFNEVAISAEFRPYAEVELHAKVSGFVQELPVDIGDRVKAGQLLAKLEVPELKDDLDRSIAAQKRAEADYKNAHQVYTRLLAAIQENTNLVLIAPQELDTAEARDHTAEAACAAAKAEVNKNQTLISYTQITAPFDGVITHRYADPGALIQSGISSDTQSLPLVRLSDNYKLRLDFPVPVNYVKDVKVGETVEVQVESLGGKILTGTISRSCDRVDLDTRTMRTEVEVPNPNLELVPGMYARVNLKVQKHPHVVSVPTEAVSAGEKHTVFTVSPQGEIEERTISVGMETPTRLEVTQGLREGELVMIGTRSTLKPGQKVETRLLGALAER